MCVCVRLCLCGCECLKCVCRVSEWFVMNNLCMGGVRVWSVCVCATCECGRVCL